MHAPNVHSRKSHVAIVTGILALLGVVVLASIGTQSGATGIQSESGSPQASPVASPVATPVSDGGRDFLYTTGEATIRITPNGFEPSHVLSAVGQDVTLTVVNTATRPLTFTIDKLGIDVEIPPGESRTVDLVDLELGEYPFHSRHAQNDPRFRGRVTIFI